jgi:predicted SprT family Zn-dependent metalloprotease
MNSIEARFLVTSLMHRHHLHSWTFGYMQSLTTAGLCWLDSDRIELSEPILRANDAAGVSEITLHEIAHALAGTERHDAEWVRIAKGIGCSGKRRPLLAQPDGKWKLKCVSCGKVKMRYRRPKEGRRLSCGLCGGGKFDARFVLRLVEEMGMGVGVTA